MTVNSISVRYQLLIIQFSIQKQNNLIEILSIFSLAFYQKKKKKRFLSSDPQTQLIFSKKKILGAKKCMLDSFVHSEKIAFASSLLRDLRMSISFLHPVNLLTSEGKDLKKKNPNFTHLCFVSLFSLDNHSFYFKWLLVACHCPFYLSNVGIGCRGEKFNCFVLVGSFWNHHNCPEQKNL